MASLSVPNAKSSVLPPSSRSILNQNLKQNHLLGFQRSSRNKSRVLKLHAQVNEVVKKSLNSAPIIEMTSEDPISEEKGRKGIPDPQSIVAFMNQVADLVEGCRLVDSRDIVVLQLKQPECEVTIRKKKALPQPPAAPVITMQAPPPPPPAMVPPSLPPPAQVTPPASMSPAVSPSASEAPAPPQPSKSSHPPLKCPMAGTFYRSPAPAAPPFVKVGDKVQKGQVVCIIEAMKLMNEIEADQSGTIVEILVEDAKPVSVDMPLFVIEP